MEKKELFNNVKSGWLSISKSDIQSKVEPFCDGYKEFLKNSKTERLCVKNFIKMLEEHGFSSDYFNFPPKKFLKPGSKFYYQTKKRSIFAGIVGHSSDRFLITRLIGSHIDSPRLDLKPNPLYEDSATCLSLGHSHYYGGIKKYQWVNLPLVMIGNASIRVKNEKGEYEIKNVDFSIGEKEDEPKFLISDLLPHLSQEQMKRSAADIIKGEELKIIFGSIPLTEDENENENEKENEKENENGEEKKEKNNSIRDPIKLNVLNYLNSREDLKGFKEVDFISSDIEFVPAQNPCDIGLDKGLISGYGQDDRVCSYIATKSILDISKEGKPDNTIFVFLSDKEETGSLGNTGASSDILSLFYDRFLKAVEFSLKNSKSLSDIPSWWDSELLEKNPFLLFKPDILSRSYALSGDVSSAYHPVFKSVDEPQNAIVLSKGPSILKYVGTRGKSYTNEASAEYLGFIRNILESNDIVYQSGELGRIDLGGGGTISMFMSKLSLDVVDAGLCLLGMHSPNEISSKIDIFNTYRFYKAFFLEKSEFKY